MKRIFTILLMLLIVGQVVGQKDIVISGASIMSAAINNEGVAYVWGANKLNGSTSGLLGIGSSADYETIPQKVTFFSDRNILIKQVNCGTGAHFAALDCNGKVWCWGNNCYGQCGTGTIPNDPNAVQSEPIQVLIGTSELAGTEYDCDGYLCNVDVVYAGNLNTFALLGGSTYKGCIVAWGGNGKGFDGNDWDAHYGQLGCGDTLNHEYPVFVLDGATNMPLHSVIQMGAGDNCAYALVDADGDGLGTVYSWGEQKASGALGRSKNGGIGTSHEDFYDPYARPVIMEDGSSLSNIKLLGYGDGEGYGLDIDGYIWSWGNSSWNNAGGIMDAHSGWIGNNSVPMRVRAGETTGASNDGIYLLAKWVSGGQGFGMAITVDNKPVAWGGGGCNSGGITGNGTLTGSSEKLQGAQYIKVTGDIIHDDVVWISRGDTWGFYGRADGTVYAWGCNDYGQLGIGNTVSQAYATQMNFSDSFRNPAPNVDLTPKNITVCTSEFTSIELDAGFLCNSSLASKYTITWYKDDVEVLFGTIEEKGITFTATELGTYKVKIEHVSDGCISYSPAVAEMTISPFEQDVVIPDITVDDNDDMPIVKLSDYFHEPYNLKMSYSVQSSNMKIVYPVVMADKLGFVQYGTGSAIISVTAMAGACSAECSFTVTVNPSQPEVSCDLSISSEITNVTCNGLTNGKIEISVSNGTEPYQYKWNTGRTSSGIYNIGAGTYSVLVMDDNGCTAEKSFTISEPSAIEISETMTKPNCNESDGKIELSVSGGIEPYSYEWSMPDGTKQTTKDIENLAMNIYEVTVTDGNSCKKTRTLSLSEESSPVVVAKNINPSKCNEATGSVEVEISGGTSPYTYEWSDSTTVSNNLNRPKMFSGSYKLRVVDSKNCSSILSVRVPLAMFRQPEIALVSYGDTARHNLVVWQKEQTNDIDEYRIYRETAQAGGYEKIGTSSYNDVSIFIDETADFNASSCRYRLSAANSCAESPLSHEYKTIQLHWQKKDNGSVQLWWDSYEGFEFVKYDLYKLTHEGLEKIKELPANKFKYTVDMVESGTIGYFVAVELIDMIDVNQYLKAEGGPFSIAFSNIAEIENRDIVVEHTKNQAFVYTKNKSIVISNAGGSNVFVFDITGKLVAQRQNVETAEIPVKTAGVYVAIVGDKVFKIIVE